MNKELFWMSVDNAEYRAYRYHLIEAARQYPSKDEQERQDRIAVGRLCGCGDCICCDELKNYLVNKE